MPERVKFAYEADLDGIKRPYLWLDLSTESGQTVSVRGALDTGAEVSVLDSAFISILGIPENDLRVSTSQDQSGPIDVQHAETTRVRAVLPGETQTVAWLRPNFVENAQVTWGRDFLETYALTLDQRSQQFSLYASEADEPSIVEGV